MILGLKKQLRPEITFPIELYLFGNKNSEMMMRCDDAGIFTGDPNF